MLPALPNTGLPQGTPPNYNQPGSSFSDLAKRKREEAADNAQFRRTRYQKALVDIKNANLTSQKIEQQIAKANLELRQTGSLSESDKKGYENMARLLENEIVELTTKRNNLLVTKDLEDIAFTDLPKGDKDTYRQYDRAIKAKREQQNRVKSLLKYPVTVGGEKPTVTGLLREAKTNGRSSTQVKQALIRLFGHDFPKARKQHGLGD